MGIPSLWDPTMQPDSVILVFMVIFGLNLFFYSACVCVAVGLVIYMQDRAGRPLYRCCF